MKRNPGGLFITEKAWCILVNPLKIPLNLDQQLDLLKKRGLIINDDKKAKDMLARLGYYRLINAYSLGLYKDTTGKNNPTYQPGVSLEQLYDIYEFDAKLRHIVFELIEYFELKFRTSIAYYLSNNFCTTVYLRSELYSNEQFYQEFLDDLEREKAAQNRSLIVQHHNLNYGGILPIWAMTEIVSFGTLSKLYKNLLPEHKRKIAAVYSTYPDLLSSWLNSFVLVRNICAHYGRLYNRNLLARPKIPKNAPKLNNYKVFSVIYLLYKYVDDPWLKLSLYCRLKNAIAQHSFVELAKVGFPTNWEEIIRREIGLPESEISSSED